LSSTIERATDYRRTAERLRRLSHYAKSEEAQKEFSRCARLYDRLAEATPANENRSEPSSARNRRKEPVRASFATSD